MKEREKFGKFGAMMAMAGSAVGLGNLWRFPYLVGANGGAAFILIYIVCSIIIAMPIFFAEFLLGRRSGKNCVGAYKAFSGGSRIWNSVGVLTIITPAIVVAYYSVIGGWSIEYLFKACTFAFEPTLTQNELSTVFSDFVSSVWPPLFGFMLFLVTVALVVVRGVKSGIERFGKIAMPALFFIVIGMAVYVGFQDGASKGYEYLFQPDFSKITTGTWASALGQAFYSLSLGCGCILTYASYVKRNQNMMRHCVSTSVIDLAFAIIAGCAIMPAVFAYGVDPSAGPALVYETLPFIFSRMPGGNVIAIVFFMALLVAALTSAISMFEVVEASIVEEFRITRRKAARILLYITLPLGILCSLSFGPLSGYHIFGDTIFELCDHLTSDFMMTLGSLFLVIFVGWKMSRHDVIDELADGKKKISSLKAGFIKMVYYTIRYISPIAILTIFLLGVLM